MAVVDMFNLMTVCSAQISLSNTYINSKFLISKKQGIKNTTVIPRSKYRKYLLTDLIST